MDSRKEIAIATAQAIQAAKGRAAELRALLGFDGFVDQIIDVVDTRTAPDEFKPITRIVGLAEKILGADGKSTNIELVVKHTKLGGNGPIMANAIAQPGVKVTYIGNLGYPTMHEVFSDFAKVADVHTIAGPGYTDALEFNDGKLMLGKLMHLSEVTWTHVVERVGLENVRRYVEEADLVGAVNWTMIPQMDGIWLGLLTDVVPNMKPKRRVFFCDFADPEKRTEDSLLTALLLLQKFQGPFEVVLGLNLKEATQVLQVLGLPELHTVEGDQVGAARAIRARLGLSCVVIHPRSGASAADESGTASFLGPFIASPKISTGGGDHFNAGFVLGQLLRLPLEQCLCLGTATSGLYVRTAKSPDIDDLVEFLLALPQPEGVVV